MNQKPVSMISVDKMITRTDPVILQLDNNIGNTIANTLGIANLFLGGKMRFDWDNLSPVYYGGMRDKLFGKDTAFGTNAIFGDKNILNDYEIFSHEMHHLWQSRAMIDSFLPNYAIQGVFAATMGGTFIEIYNYYEQFGYFHYWFK